MEGGITATEKLLALAQLPTAIVCSNDMTAIGVLHGLHRTTHKVPDDISVVGFDDIHLAQFMLPPLTTVQMSCKHLAAAAVQALRAGIEPDIPRRSRESGRSPPSSSCASPLLSRAAACPPWRRPGPKRPSRRQKPRPLLFL